MTDATHTALWRRPLVWVLALVVVACFVFFCVVPARVEQSMNGIAQPPPYTVPTRAAQLHASLAAADLHADSLLWGRDLLQRGQRGQVDVPRLIEGGVAVQVFSVVSKTPRHLNIERNDDHSDNILPLAIAQRWPLRTWFSLKQRALYQAGHLHRMADASDGRLVVVDSGAALQQALTRRKSGTPLVAGVLAIEGAQVLEGDPANVEVLFDAGYRMMSPSHFFDTEMGGSAHGLEKSGLTERGREMVRRMEARHMIVDLAHASPATIDDVLRIATRPVVVSHTGVKGTCDNRRNLSDDQLRRIAAQGGLIGIGFWETAVCGRDAAHIAGAIRYAANLIGVEHIALGSDFDGAVETPFDVTGLPLLTAALIDAGFSDDEIRALMGGNTIRFLLAQLPSQ